MPERPKKLKSPISALPSPNARLYPHSTQTMLTTAMAMKLYMSVLMTFLARTRPP